MKYEKKSKEELKNEVKKLSEELEQKLESLFSSNEYVEFLSVMAKRPTYSMHNNLLIYNKSLKIEIKLFLGSIPKFV